jgi:hypothetical protein
MNMIDDLPGRVTLFRIFIGKYFHDANPKEWIFGFQQIRSHVRRNVDKGKILQAVGTELVEVLLSHAGWDVKKGQNVMIRGGFAWGAIRPITSA